MNEAVQKTKFDSVRNERTREGQEQTSAKVRLIVGLYSGSGVNVCS